MTLSELLAAVQTAVDAGHGELPVRVVALNGDDDFIAFAFSTDARGPTFDIEAASEES